jgi:CrcB protein
VGSGGFLGALARYYLGGLFKIPAGGFPLGTFIINLTGSFVLGLFITLLTTRLSIRTEWRLFFATGFIGAYTTFSSFSNEVWTLYKDGYIAIGVLYSVASLVGGMLCVGAGVILAHRLPFKKRGSNPNPIILPQTITIDED